MQSKALSTPECHAGFIFCLIYPYLSYGNITWGNEYSTRLQPIRKIRKKIIRIITFLKSTDHTSPLLKELSILHLDGINNEAIALFMYLYFHNMLPSAFNNFFSLNKGTGIHKYNTRSSSNVQKIQARTNYQKYSVKYKGILVWNNLTKSMKDKKLFLYLRKKSKLIFSSYRKINIYLYEILNPTYNKNVNSRYRKYFIYDSNL